jgi:hypothetical protein
MGSPKGSGSNDLEPLKKAASIEVANEFTLQSNGLGEVNFDVKLKRRSAQILVITPQK